jgi:hypothetical protein
MAQEGFEPSASLVLSESGLPVAYRASEISSEGWNRTSGLHVQSVASLPAATAPESSETVFSKTFSQFHGFYESHGFGHFATEVTGFGDWFGDVIHPLCWRSANKKSPAF